MSSPDSASLSGPALDVREVRLENGLRLLFLPDPAVPVFTIMLWVPAGARTEPRGLSGISHYLEHCYSLGSRKLAPREIDRLVQRLGGSKNAFTDYDCTAYYESLPSSALETIVEVEADRLGGLLLPEERLRSELDVVREERRLRTDDSVGGYLHEKLLALAYERHPYGRPIIGTPEDLAAMNREKVLAYYRAHYVPSNVRYVLVGDFEPARAEELFRRHFGAIPAGAPPRVEIEREPEQRAERRARFTKEGARLPRLTVLWKTVGIDDEDAVALAVLEVALAHGDASRFERVLRRERQLVTDHAVDYWALADASPFTYRAEAQPGVELEAIEEAALGIFDDVARSGPKEREVERAKKQIELAFLTGLESTGARARAIGRYATLSRRGWRYLLDYLEKVRAIGPDDLRRAAACYLVPERRTVVHLYPPELPA
jgi:predicted Zn-dependent peptidase